MSRRRLWADRIDGPPPVECRNLGTGKHPCPVCQRSGRDRGALLHMLDGTSPPEWTPHQRTYQREHPLDALDAHNDLMAILDEAGAPRQAPPGEWDA